jgi:hypothetical protein
LPQASAKLKRTELELVSFTSLELTNDSRVPQAIVMMIVFANKNDALLTILCAVNLCVAKHYDSEGVVV